jgi:hypothetical protein
VTKAFRRAHACAPPPETSSIARAGGRRPPRRGARTHAFRAHRGPPQRRAALRSAATDDAAPCARARRTDDRKREHRGLRRPPWQRAACYCRNAARPGPPRAVGDARKGRRLTASCRVGTMPMEAEDSLVLQRKCPHEHDTNLKLLQTRLEIEGAHMRRAGHRGG